MSTGPDVTSSLTLDGEKIDWQTYEETLADLRAVLEEVEKSAIQDGTKISRHGHDEAVFQAFDILEAHLHEKIESRRIGYTEYSSIDGVLDLVSTRKRPHFSLKEHGTGRYVPCTFTDELFDEVKKALGKRIVIEGKVKFRPDGTPLSAHAVRIFIRPQPTRSLDELIGSLPNFTEGVSAGEYVRQLRGDEEG